MMAKKEDTRNPGGINGTNQAVVNINAKDYRELQLRVQEHAKGQDREVRLRTGLVSISLQMQGYLKEERPEELIRVGAFLKQYLVVIGAKNKDFAKFLNVEESNLSSILSGRRRISVELAFKLGQLFDIEPSIWLLIQSKNELLAFASKQGSKRTKYRLKDLLKSVS